MVEYIYGKQVAEEGHEFLVKWAGYGKIESSWEPHSNIEINNVPAIVRFEQS
jgi:hypothetical protein